MDDFKSFAVTVLGGSHIKSGAICQDASNFYNDESVSIAVTADGHGDSSCFRSDRGADYAVQCAIKGIQQFVKEHETLFQSEPKKKTESFLEKLLPKKDAPTPPPFSHRELEKLIREKLIRQIVASWDMLVAEECQRRPFTEKELQSVSSEKYRNRYNKDHPDYKDGKYLSKAYGTSLIAAAVTPHYWFAFHIGDGRFTVLYKDSSGDQPVPWDSKCYLNVTTSICDDDILDRGEEGVRTYLSLHSEKAPPVALFLCSDGIDDNYPVDEKENAECLYRLYREIAVTFAEDGYESTCGADGKSGQIKDLANGFATKGKGDDTSLAGIVHIEALKKVVPDWKKKMAAYKAEIEKNRAETGVETKANDKAGSVVETKANDKAGSGPETKSDDKSGSGVETKPDDKAGTETKPQIEAGEPAKPAEEVTAASETTPPSFKEGFH